MSAPNIIVRPGPVAILIFRETTRSTWRSNSGADAGVSAVMTTFLDYSPRDVLRAMDAHQIEVIERQDSGAETDITSASADLLRSRRWQALDAAIDQNTRPAVGPVFLTPDLPLDTGACMGAGHYVWGQHGGSSWERRITERLPV